MRISYGIPLVFLVGRLFLLLAIPIDNLAGLGDYWNFFGQAALGIPFIEYWSEFPPGFPFLSALIYTVVGGREVAYMTLLAIVFSVIQAGAILVFILICELIYPTKEAERRGWIYAALSIGLVFTWWYFDILAVLFILLGLYWVLKDKFDRAAIAAGLGALVKLFPFLLVVLPWRFADRRTAVRFTLICSAVLVIPLLVLLAISPEMMRASLTAQLAKGPWETIWALISGNVETGNFGVLVDRTNPAALDTLPSRDALVPSWLTLLIFVGIGYGLFLRVNSISARAVVGFLGTTWCLFLIWSPGYSPQWVIYLVPLILLALPERIGILMCVVLIGLNLLEWPILLSRGLFTSLWVLIPLRTVLLVFLAVEFWRPCRVEQV